MTFPNSFLTLRKSKKMFFHSVFGNLEGAGTMSPPHSSCIQKPHSNRVSKGLYRIPITYFKSVKVQREQPGIQWNVQDEKIYKTNIL